MFISNVIILTFTLIMFYFFIKDYKSYNNNKHIDYKSLIISSGVLGTFIGIFIGLMDFNTQNIKDSIPILLEGLKVAFLTSILGMFLSILLSFLQKSTKKEDRNELEILNSIDENLRNNSINIINLLNEKFDKTNSILLKSIDTLSKGATKEIINSLENIIKDFNRNLTEQFGENFKELNESVKNMIIWQNSYKESITILNSSLEKSINKISNLDNRLENITTNYEKIDFIHNRLEEIIKTNENQINNIEIHLKNLKIVGDDAKLIVSSIETFSNTIKGSLSNQSSSLNQMLKDGRVLQNEIEKQLPVSLGKLNEVLTSLTNKFEDDYSSFLENFSELLKISSRGIKK